MKKSVFVSDSLKMSVLFDKNFYKSINLKYCLLLVNLKVPILFLCISVVKEMVIV